MTINPTTELEKELLAALGEQVLKVRKLERALDAALEVSNKKDSAVKTLDQMRYVYQGGELWKPPLGKPPVWSSENKVPMIDQSAVDPRHVV